MCVAKHDLPLGGLAVAMQQEHAHRSTQSRPYGQHVMDASAWSHIAWWALTASYPASSPACISDAMSASAGSNTVELQDAALHAHQW